MSSQTRPQKQKHMIQAPLDCEDSDAVTPNNLPAVTSSTNGGTTTTDKDAAEKIMRDELIRLGDHVVALTSDQENTEDDEASFGYLHSYFNEITLFDWLSRDFEAAQWHVLKTKRSQIKGMYEAMKRRMQATEENCDPKPFLKTGLGRLAPEIREQIFSNLLAFPPPYPGREYLVKQIAIDGRSPISLDRFVHLKASCLTVLQTCRQIYLEAFPIFYARKSYYLANAQELQKFSNFDLSVSMGPKHFRADTITSLCLNDLLRNMPKWRPENIEYFMSRSYPHSREELEAERVDRLDPELTFGYLVSMRCLRKICLCMRVGQEQEYLEFLSRIYGLEHGVIDILDNFHWAIRSQNVQEDPRKLHYSAFPYESVLSIKNWENFGKVRIQRRELVLASRPSDLTEGNERWVEVEIGSRNYEKRMSKVCEISSEMEVDSSDDGSDIWSLPRLGTAENDSSSILKRWTLLAKRGLNMVLRCAALMLAMCLFYVFLCAKLQETFSQLLALLCGVLIALLAFSSTSG